jgi:hypothetical protein
MPTYLSSSPKHWACDIEADNLLDEATRIWCVCLENIETGEKHAFTEQDSFNGWLGLNPNYILVGHNFIAYDLVMLNRFWGSAIGISRVVDTFVLSQLYNPSSGGQRRNTRTSPASRQTCSDIVRTTRRSRAACSCG